MVARQIRPRLRTTSEQARQRFERWRRIRPHLHSPIPEALWALAVKTAQEHGASRTARLLRLNYERLKNRLPTADVSALGLQPSAGFLELAPPRPAESFPCTLELEKAQGAKMKIHLASPGSVDRLERSRSFWCLAS